MWPGPGPEQPVSGLSLPLARAYAEYTRPSTGASLLLSEGEEMLIVIRFYYPERLYFLNIV